MRQKLRVTGRISPLDASYVAFVLFEPLVGIGFAAFISSVVFICTATLLGSAFNSMGIR